MESIYYWISEIALIVSSMVYARTLKRREQFRRRLMIFAAAYAAALGIFHFFPFKTLLPERVIVKSFGFAFLICFLYSCWELSRSTSVYVAIWSFISWQMMCELWVGMQMRGLGFWAYDAPWGWTGFLLIFIIGNPAIAFTAAGWIFDGVLKTIGPRQITSACLIFLIFQVLGLGQENMGVDMRSWVISYLLQILLVLILYLQNELFKKSAMRQELEAMNILLKKEQEQYKLSKENIALINQKCHDLKHQIRAIRNMQKEDIGQYLAEIEDTIQIYEALVKTGNEALDTILTEKSLYCKGRGIIISCVADGSQMQFINTVDLYAILGNAIDNAIEAVEKFEQQEKRQIDVLIYRQQNFLVINIINPLKGNLEYEGELPVSIKGDKRFHGFGLRSIRYLVKKYDGCLSVSEEDGCFSLKILMPVP